MPGGAAVAQGTLNPLTLVRIQAGQPRHPFASTYLPANA